MKSRLLGSLTGSTLLLAAAVMADEPAGRHGPSVNPAAASYTFTAAPFTPDYQAPAPGSYRLPVIDTISDHVVVGTDGIPILMSALTRGRLAVVAFVYTSCAEVTGCPLAEAILQRLDRGLAQEPQTARRVRLLSVSFDPERDTPERMETVRGFYQPKTDWAFVTTRDETALQPILDDFGQSVAKLYFDDGAWTGLFRHVLKVFLVDEHNRIRNIYSSGLISTDLVLNDIRTLVLEDNRKQN